MKKIIFLFCFSFLLQFSFAQSAKLYLIIFKDKDHSPYSILQPEEFLSEKSIARRKKQNISINLSDIPVNSFYISKINAVGVPIVNKSKWLNAVTVSVSDEDQLIAIKNLSFVKEVLLTSDFDTRMLQPAKLEIENNPLYVSNQLTKQKSIFSTFDYGPSFYQANQIGVDCMHSKGYLGEGMTIAVFDVGFFKVDALPAFDSLRINKQILGCRDFMTGDTMVYEDAPHGMNVLSCMGGYLPGQLIGTAPKANYWLLRTEDAYTETLHEEVIWLVGAEFADSVGADIINSSLGYRKFDGGIGDHSYSDLDGNTTIVTKAADWAASKGIFVVNSAGNFGGSPWYKIIAPADADSILTVGAVDSSGNIASFSSRGLTADGRIKPNTCARGSKAVTAATSGGITTFNGTSFSAPITAGAAACLWQANPTAGNMQLLFAIERSGDQYFVPDSIRGYGIPDFCFADSVLQIIAGKKENLVFDELKIFPNPFSTTLRIDYYADNTDHIRFELFDITGRIIANDEQEVTANSANQIIFSDIASLSNGIYFFRLISSKKVYCSKIIKQ